MHRYILFFLLNIFFIITILSKPLLGAEVESNAALNFENNWMRYDAYYQAYLPLKLEECKKQATLYQLVDYEQYKKYSLYVVAFPELSIFSNNKLIYKNNKKSADTLFLAMADFEPDELGRVVFAFHHTEKKFPLSDAKIMYKPFESEKNVHSDTGWKVFKNNRKKYSDSYFLLFVLLLSLFVLFRRLYPREFGRNYVEIFFQIPDHLTPSSFSIPSLWMAIMNGLSISLLLQIIELDYYILGRQMPVWEVSLRCVIYYLLFFVGKFVYTWIMAWLFNFTKQSSSQFMEYIRLFEWFCLFGAFIMYALQISGLTHIELKPEVLYFMISIIMIICIVKVILLFFKVVTHRNLYLFSYLCAAEIVPFVIAVKILLF